MLYILIPCYQISNAVSNSIYKETKGRWSLSFLAHWLEDCTVGEFSSNIYRKTCKQRHYYGINIKLSKLLTSKKMDKMCMEVHTFNPRPQRKEIDECLWWPGQLGLRSDSQDRQIHSETRFETNNKGQRALGLMWNLSQHLSIHLSSKNWSDWTVRLIRHSYKGMHFSKLPTEQHVLFESRTQEKL